MKEIISEREHGRKKLKRSTGAADEIDAQFHDVSGLKVVRYALELALAPTPVESKTAKRETWR